MILKRLLIFTSILWGVGYAYADTLKAENGVKIIQLDEQKLIQYFQSGSSQRQQVLANQFMQTYQRHAVDQNYQWQWVSQINHSDSDEEAIASFIPTFGPTYTYQTGVQKKFSGGLSLDARVFADQQSTVDGNIDEATRTGVTMDFSIDLWRNLFGRVDRAELKDAKLSHEKSEIQSGINMHIAELELRKLYWNIVATRLKLDVTEELLKSSRQQLRDAQKRGRQYIADKGEVARYRAQVASREAVLKNLEYQRDLYIQSLKSELPELLESEIQISVEELTDKYAAVYQCANAIGNTSTVPWENTKIDELLDIVEQSYEQKKIISRRYSDLDIQLNTRLQYSGVEQGYADSLEEFSDNSKSGYQLGLSITVPLGSEDSKAKEAKEKSEYFMYLAEKTQLTGQVRAKHKQTVSMVHLLNQAIASLNVNDKNLTTSIQSSRKKFRQARISLNNLLGEQDQLLNTKLTTIDTQLLVITTLYDYFQVFTDDPCIVNRIGGKS